MPSPFPGMDPFLEEPSLWPDVHHRLISEIQATLNTRLRPKYYARVEVRVYISDEDDPGRVSLVPDVRIGAAPSGDHLAKAPSSQAGVAVLGAVEPVEVMAVWEEEIQEPQIQIVERELHQVVTVIEVLSPSNKTAGSRGRASYVEKRHEILRSPTAWVEIDLLRAGIPILPREVALPCDYMIHVSWPQRRPKSKVWPIRLKQRLPEVPIPLREGDPDAVLNLQEVLDQAYEHGAYDLSLNYKDSPATPPLKPEDAAWVDQLLREKGVR
jgi:hypothetical protein